jgi:hypothetical protein
LIPLIPDANAASATLRNGPRHTGPDLLRRTGIALGAVIGGGILSRHARVLLAVLGTDLPLLGHQVANAARSAL